MASVTIYTKSWCPYCLRAKELLTVKGAAFTEIDIEKYPDKLEEMMTRSGQKRTVPQIFINDKHVGGCDDLYSLDGQGGLDELLAH